MARTSKAYFHRVPERPADVEVVERLAVRQCVRRGAAVDLVLERGRENRSQFVTTTVRGRDCAVSVDGQVIASVERKSLQDLVTVTSGKPNFALADLAAYPRSALVVEDRCSAVFKLGRVRPAVVADGLAECHVRFPGTPIVFCAARPLAEEWTYRYLAAADAELGPDPAAAPVVADLPAAGPLTDPPAASSAQWGER